MTTIKIAFSILTGLCAFLINSGAWAEDSDFHGRFYLEPEVMAAVPTGDDTDTTVFLGGRAGRELTKWFDIEIEAGWAEFDGTFKGEKIEEDTIIPLLGNVKIHIGERERFDPYLLLGFGVSFNDLSFDESRVLEVIGRESGIDVSGAHLSANVEDSFAFQIGGGLLYHMNENWSGFVEARFFHTSPDASVRASVNGNVIEDTLDNLDVDVFFFGAGTRIRI
jgi:opacity protein-like surface antigen